MDLNLNPNLGAGRRGPHRAGELGEDWVHRNMYCPACQCDELDRLPPGTELIDFRCDSCEETFQLKSQKHRFGRKVLDSAWSVLGPAVKENRAPGFFFLQYAPMSLQVSHFFIVPGHFINLQTVERRKELSPTARRAGYVGSYVLLSNVPEEALIPVIEAPIIRSPVEVRERWRRFAFVKKSRMGGRGWIGDVLRCVEQLGKREFTLREVYEFEEELRERHPRNRNVRPKIRQQLQVLRKHGIVQFLERGKYRLL